MSRGHLIIQFTVKFPPNNWIPAKKITELEKYLPPRKEVEVPTENAYECVLHDFDESEYVRQQRQAARDEDDEDGYGGGQRVQCASS